MTRISAIVLLYLAAGAWAGPPNVLFIAIDDLNDWVGFMGGHPQVQTPHMDRLARSGTVFLNAHCQSPLCNPSRTSLMTGLRPTTTGVYALEPWFRKSPPLQDWVALPQYFAAHGYRTLATGKLYHDGSPPRGGEGRPPEFDVQGPAGSHGPLPPKKFVDTPQPHRLVDWGVFPEKDEDQDDWKVTSWAIEQLAALPKDQPFFLGVGLRKPHVPCFAPPKWFDLYPQASLVMPPFKPDDRDDTPRASWYLHWRLPEPRTSWLQANDQWKSLVQAYLACVSFTDSQVGRLVAALRESGHAPNTIVVLWSDHGYHLGEKGITGKTTLWERSTRVPLVWAGPGVAAGGRCAQPAELLDIYPTLVELCGLPPRQGLDGLSLVPQLQDASTPRARPALTTHGPDNHGVRTSAWRYIRYGDGSEELYDLQADPNEWTNLASDAKHAERKRELARWLPQSSHAPLPGSKSRLIEYRDAQPYWETEPVDPASEPG